MRKLLLLFFVIPFFSCRTLNPSLMFKTDKELTVDSTLQRSSEYLIAPGDHIDMRILTNDGFKLVDVTQGTLGGISSTFFLVESDGYVKLPLLGRTFLRGFNVQEAEKVLEDKYAFYFVTPFILLRVTNREVLIFAGDGGTGTVVNLGNENTTLLEALTMAGGIHARGKAYKIKLIRGNYRDPQVYHIDLSTIERMKKTNLTVQAKDIIYVEPSPEYSARVLSQITPYVGILTTVLLVFTLLKK